MERIFHPSVPGIIYAGKHNIAGLNAATRYEARVAAKNNHGWSRPSPTFHFATFGAGNFSQCSS